MSKTSLIVGVFSMLWAVSTFSLPQSITAPEVPQTKSHESPFACNRLALTPGQRKRHFDELGPQLVSLRKDVRELPNGYEFEFPADFKTVQLVGEWVAGERACCPFFDIEMRLEREGGPLWLRLTGREGVKQFIRADGAKWVKK